MDDINIFLGMKNSIKLFLMAFVMIIFSCKNGHDKNETELGEKHWSYEGETSPKHWAEIEKKEVVKRFEIIASGYVWGEMRHYVQLNEDLRDSILNWLEFELYKK